MLSHKEEVEVEVEEEEEEAIPEVLEVLEVLEAVEYIGSVKDYQIQLKSMLDQIFHRDDIVVEWSSMNDERDRTLYSPRLDVAVGPFATHERLETIYDDMINSSKSKILLTKLIEYNKINLEVYDNFVEAVDYERIRYLNYNSRCFLAIEIENNVSRKHLMGGVMNAGALGRIGIMIPWTPEKLRAMVKAVRYIGYLRYAEKNTFNTDNLLIVTRDQMVAALNETIRSRS